MLRREFRFLHKPLNLWSRLLLLAAAATIAASIFFPLWKMHLVAPQYSDGLDLYIFPYKIQGGGLNGQHLIEINNLNHYIGMKPIQEADFMEMRWMPFVFGLIILMTLRSIVFGEMSNVVDLFAVYSYFGVFSIGSFWYRLYQYGHNLDPHAPMHIKPFTPRLIGVEQIANFREHSFPQAGAYLLCVSVLLIVLAGWFSRKETLAHGSARICVWEGTACDQPAVSEQLGKVRFGDAEPARCKRALPDYRDRFRNAYAELRRFRNASMRPRLTRRSTSKRAFTPARSSSTNRSRSSAKKARKFAATASAKS